MSKNNHLTAIFFMYCATIAIDGFPLGIELLREFGARPSNIFIAISIPYLLKEDLLSSKISRYDFLYALLIFTAITSSINLTWTNYNTILGKSPITQFLNQILMLTWMIISIKIITKLLDQYADININSTEDKIYRTSSYLNIFLFLIHYLIVINLLPENYMEGFSAIKSNLDKFRASGLSTEPSLYGAWLVWIWPLILFQKNFKYKYLTVLILATTGVLSGSRTFLVIVTIQGVYIAYVKSDNVNYKKLAILCVFTAITAPLLGPRLVSTFDIYENLSSIARIASTIASINAYGDNLMLGIGLGQFSAFYEKYVPSFGYASDEVIEWIGGDINNRVSTFNLFTRIAAETGTIGLILITLIPISLIKKSTAIIKKTQSEKYLSYATSAIGGISFWLSQDQFGYQPGIFGIAALHHIISQYKKNEE